jgi:hypothetical protein
MTLRVVPLLALLIVAANVACRDAASSPARPNFDIVAADTLPGGCTDRVCNFHASGNAAFVSWSPQSSGNVARDTGAGGGGGGGTIQFGSASVSRGGDRGEQQTFFNYSVVECSPFFFCNQVAGGFGVIPNADFDAQGPNYRVSTNTAGNPNFFTFAGSPGTITIEWVPNGLFSTRFNGTRRTTQPGFTEQQAGQSDDQSASAGGSVVGFAIGSGSFGQISSSHDVRITITR